MAELILFLLLLLLIASLLIRSVKAISDYYMLHYSFSVWAGALLIFISFLLFALASISSTRFCFSICIIVALFLIIFTLVQDVRLSTMLKGVGVFLFQIIITILCIPMLLTIFTRRVFNLVLGRKTIASRISPGLVLGLNTGAPFMYFFTLGLKNL